MDTKEILDQLNDVRELMTQEKYADAISLIDNLKKIEKDVDFDYTFTHQLYQLDSNARSLHNQQIILKYLQTILSDQKIISFHELNQLIKKDLQLNLSDDILRREIEILILRNQLTCKLDGENIIL